MDGVSIPERQGVGIFVAEEKLAETAAFSKNANSRFTASGTKIRHRLERQRQGFKVPYKSIVYMKPRNNKTDEFRLKIPE